MNFCFALETQSSYQQRLNKLCHNAAIRLLLEYLTGVRWKKKRKCMNMQGQHELLFLRRAWAEGGAKPCEKERNFISNPNSPLKLVA